MTDHPITPPPELFAEWFADTLRTLSRKVSEDDRGTTGLIAGAVAIQAARWGADQQLAKDAKWLDYNALSETHLKVIPVGESLKEAMRPKPPSLKEQALQALENADGANHPEASQALLATKPPHPQTND